MRQLFTLLLASFLSLVSYAETLPSANAEYSAIRQIEMAQGSLTQTVHHSFGKERVESNMGGMAMVMIVRPDQKLAWQLMPMQKMYMEINMGKAAEMTGKVPDEVTIERVGEETIDGLHTTKYKMLMKDKSAGGFIWLSDEHIPVQMDFLSKEGGQKNRVKMTLKQLQVGPQDPKLFELPPGLNKMPDMGGFIPPR